MNADATEKRPYRIVGTRPARPDGVDKVTGRACYGADYALPGMLHARILRSPHAHARILGVNIERALKLEGVHAVISGVDFPEVTHSSADHIRFPVDVVVMSKNVMAREKVLYCGHAVAAVAAVSTELAERALAEIIVDYQVLPHVLDMDVALAPDAPVLAGRAVGIGKDVSLAMSSNVTTHIILDRGSVNAGFAKADLVIERQFSTPAVHQAYIECHACVASSKETGQIDIWCSTQGGFLVRAYVARILGLDESLIKVTPSEIGGGFGGKLVPYLEPVAALLAQRAARPVKLCMTRAEVFVATGPAPATRISFKAGATKEGRLTALSATLKYEAGAFPGGSMHEAQTNIFSCYDVPNLRSEGFEILVNKPNVAPYRAPGLPQALLACESVIDELAAELGIDPIEFRLLNAVHEGDQTINGATLGPLGLRQALLLARAHPHYLATLRPGVGRGVAAAFYVGAGCRSSVTAQLTETGKLVLLLGTPDIGGSRASMAMMAAETLGIPLTDVNPQIVDTMSVAYSDCTGGSRVTFATGMAVIKVARELCDVLRHRAAVAWGIGIEDVVWRDGTAMSVHDSRTLDIARLAADAHCSGSPITISTSVDPAGAAPSCAVNMVDVDVDPETGRVRVLRFTAIQDAGQAIHPDYVEGQMQGGAAQGIGWALNEEYLYDAGGALINAGFLDYRIPVASDLPMLDTVIVEVPNPDHPYGVRGVGETPICAPMAAVAIAVNRALGTRIGDMPLSPPRVLDAIQSRTRLRDLALTDDSKPHMDAGQTPAPPRDHSCNTALFQKVT